ncbi:hypothetical protein GE061_011050 [Apolygus lucorum]|uniref:Uncharacterized protein n=1 Tax=Apolygus lucorum TaxID=248454 RepID=A0A8S9XYE7_APOLU|nr:hypothetical protein GE061_011050 [Apolygus lucorum]
MGETGGKGPLVKLTPDRRWRQSETGILESDVNPRYPSPRRLADSSVQRQCSWVPLRLFVGQQRQLDSESCTNLVVAP